MESEAEAERSDVPLVGWYRRDDTRKLLWLLLPSMIPPILGSLLIGFAYPRIDTIDPLGVRQHPAGRRVVESDAIGPTPRRRGDDVPVDEKSDVWAYFAFGLALVVSGPGIVIWGLRRSWRDEATLMLRVDGLVHEDETGKLRVLWEEIERVRYDEQADAVALMMRGDEPTIRFREQFAGTTKKKLAEHLEDVRRKASFGLLPQQRR